MLLNIVTDNELIVSEVVKTILLVIITGAIIFNAIRLIRNNTLRKRALNIVMAMLFGGAWVYVFGEFRIEADLLRHPVYVKGTTTGYCKVFARGTGIEFEYELDGKKYRACNSFYPVPKDSIQVPGGIYMVRCSERVKDKGRMVFKKTGE